MRDPVCGLEIDPAKAAAQEAFKGNVFYFCSENCRKEFAKAPERYARAGGSGQPAGGAAHPHPAPKKP